MLVLHATEAVKSKDKWGMLRSAEVDETSKQIIKIEKIEEGRRNGIIVMSQELEVLMSLQTTSITQLCRVCLTKNSYLESLFSMPNNSPHEKTLADILPCIANVKVRRTIFFLLYFVI